MGQAFEVPVRFESLATLTPTLLEDAFTRAYQRYYGFTRSDPVECVSWRLLAIGRVAKPRLHLVSAKTREGGDAVKGTRKAFFEEASGFTDARVLNRYALTPGTLVEGPAIVEERESTAVVPPGWTATTDQHANLDLQRRR
jgi:N-methylhydantoinase A